MLRDVFQESNQVTNKKTALRDVFHYTLAEQFNEQTFKGIIDKNANIGDEMAVKNPEYNPKTNPDVPQKLYYFPIKGERYTYLLKSEDIEQLPLHVTRTTKVSFGNRAYERIDEAFPVSISSKKEFEYRDYIEQLLPYEHIVPREWLVWKILTEVAIRDKVFVRAISYPAWAKTSTFYVLNQLRNDIEIVDGGTFAKLKHSLSVQPRVLVLDEVDDLSTDEKRFLAKLIRSCGDGRGKVNNDSRAVNGTAEVFNLMRTSLIALYNFPTQEKQSFFETNFHDKILDRMFPILLDGGGPTQSPLLHKHHRIRDPITQEEVMHLKKFLWTSMYYTKHFLDELGDKRQWQPSITLDRKRWSYTYNAVCDGLKMYSRDKEEFHSWEKVFYQMHDNYNKYKRGYEQGVFAWNFEIPDDAQGQITLARTEEVI